MIVGRPIIYTGDGVNGTLSTQYPGTCVASPSPGCVIADIVVPGVGTLYGVRQTWAGPGASNSGPQPGTWLWTGAW